MNLREVKGLWDQLKALRETMPDGVIHEAQVYQLKQWGPLALQHVEEIEIAVKLEDPQTVEFRAKGVTMAVPENFPQILEGLDRSVKSLLGRHWATKVLVDGAVIFEGQGRPRPKKDLAKIIKRIKDADAAAKQGDSAGK
jgi:hypothetical protein